MEQGPSYLTSVPEYRITWPETDLGQTASVNCPCGTLDTTSYQATRVCGGDYTSGAEWRSGDVSPCVFSDTTLRLCQVTEVRYHEQCIYACKLIVHVQLTVLGEYVLVSCLS